MDSNIRYAQGTIPRDSGRCTTDTVPLITSKYIAFLGCNAILCPNVITLGVFVCSVRWLMRYCARRTNWKQLCIMAHIGPMRIGLNVHHHHTRTLYLFVSRRTVMFHATSTHSYDCVMSARPSRVCYCYVCLCQPSVCVLDTFS